MPAQPSKNVCLFHDADRQAALTEARRAGGRAGRKATRLQRLMPATLKPMLETLMDALNETHTGTLEPQRATAMAALAGAIVKVYGQGQLEERLERLEAAAELRQRVAG